MTDLSEKAQFLKYACGRDRVLHGLTVGSGVSPDAQGGDRAAPTGRFTRLAVIPAGQVDAVVAAYGHLAEGDAFNPAELAGHFIVTETGDGFVYVGEFQKEHQAEDEFEQLTRKYAKWLTAEKVRREAADAANGVQRCTNCADAILAAETQALCVPCDDARMAGAFDDEVLSPGESDDGTLPASFGGNDFEAHEVWDGGCDCGRPDCW